MSVKAKRNISSILRDMLRKPQLLNFNMVQKRMLWKWDYTVQCGYYFHTFVSFSEKKNVNSFVILLAVKNVSNSSINKSTRFCTSFF